MVASSSRRLLARGSSRTQGANDTGRVSRFSHLLSNSGAFGRLVLLGLFGRLVDLLER